MGLNSRAIFEDYMDDFGYSNLMYPNTLGLKAQRNKGETEYEKRLDRLGLDVKLYYPPIKRGPWVDEKFLPDGKPHISVALELPSGRQPHGPLTSTTPEYEADYWLFGIPMWCQDKVCAMDVYFVATDKLRKEVETRIGWSMEDLYKKGKEMLDKGIDTFNVTEGYRLVKKPPLQTKIAVDLEFPLSLLEEVAFHKVC